MIFELVENYAEALDVMPVDHPGRKNLKLLDEAIRRDVHFVDRHPTTIFQCLWNTCWWYDCRDAAGHYVETEGPWSNSGGMHLFELAEDWRREKHEKTPDFVWIRSLRPPQIQLGTARTIVLQGHNERLEVIRAEWSVGGNLLASTSQDRTVRIWDANSGREMRRLEPGEYWVSAVAWVPGDRQLATAAGRNWLGQVDWEDQWGESPCSIVLWDTTTGDKIIEMNGHEEPLTSLDCFRDGSRLASGSEDTTVRIWDLRSGNELLRLKGHSATISTVAVCPRDQRIATSAADGLVCIWNVESGSLLQRLEGHRDPVNDVVWSPDGSLVVSGGGGVHVSGNKDYGIRVWDAATGAKIATMTGHEYQVTSLSWPRGSKYLASASQDGTVRLWDLESKTEIRRIEEFRDRLGRRQSLKSIAISPNGTKLATCGEQDRVVRLWNLDGAREPNTPVDSVDAVVGEICWIDKGHVLTERSGIASVWRVASGLPAQIFQVQDTCVACSPDSKYVASAFYYPHHEPGEPGGYSLEVTEMQSGQLVWKRETSAGSASSLKWSPDSRHIVVRWRGDVHDFWECSTGTRYEQLQCHNYSWSGDGQLLAIYTEDDSLIRVIDMWQKKPLAKLKVDNLIWTLRLSPSGHWLAAGWFEGATLWNLRKDNECSHLSGVHEGVSALDFAPDEKQLATWSFDELGRLWDVDSQSEVCRLEGHTDAVNGDIVYTVDGSRVVTRSGDQTIRIWERNGDLISWISISGSNIFDVRSAVEQLRLSSYWARPDETKEETIIACASSASDIAWYPKALSRELTMRTQGRIWAGGADDAGEGSRWFYLLALEGSLPEHWGAKLSTQGGESANRRRPEQWFYQLDGEATIGPIKTAELARLIQEGVLTRDHHVSPDNKKWFKASQLRGAKWP